MTAKQIYYIVLAALAAVGTGIAEAVGGWDAQTKLLAGCMVVDYLTGFLCAVFWHNSPKSDNGSYNSAVGFKGLARKGVIVLVVVIAELLDRLTGTPAMRTATILFFSANEAMSIFENLGIMGVPFPPAMKQAFEVLKKQNKESVPTLDTSEQPGVYSAPTSSPYTDLSESLGVDADEK